MCVLEAADRRLASNLHNMDATWTSRPYHKNKKRLPSFGTECSNPGESSSFSTPLISPYHKFKSFLSVHYQLGSLPYTNTTNTSFMAALPGMLKHQHQHSITFACEDEIAVYSKHVCIHIPISIFPFPTSLPPITDQKPRHSKKASFFPTPESHPLVL